MPKTLALAGATTASAADASAVSVNPAALASVGGTSALVSLVLGAPIISASGKSIALEGEQSYGLHLAFNPKDLLGGRIGFGFSTQLPHRRSLHFTIHALEEAVVPIWENSTELLEIRVGVAVKIVDWLSLGASALLLAGLSGEVQIEAPFQSSDDIDPAKRTTVTMDVLLPDREFLVLGLEARPTDKLSFGLVYRQATFVPVILPIDFSVEFSSISLPTVARLAVNAKYSPEELRAGVAYQLSDELGLLFDLGFARFDRYEVPLADVTIDVSELGDSITLLPPEKPHVDLRNLWLPRLGVTWRPGPTVELDFGTSYARSFIRNTNRPVLDNARLAISAGTAVSIGRALSIDALERVRVLLGAEGIFFLPKDTAGLSHGGLALALAFGIELRG